MTFGRLGHWANFWHEWRGSLDGRPTFWLRRLIYIPVWKRAGKWLGCRVDLHKFIASDDDECFHTHPAWAVRIVLWGGYKEEVHHGMLEGTTLPVRSYKRWKPGMAGIIRPEFCHRIEAVLNGRSSYSLWLRGPICAPVHLVGNGWPEEYRGGVSPQGGKS